MPRMGLTPVEAGNPRKGQGATADGRSARTPGSASSRLAGQDPSP